MRPRLSIIFILPYQWSAPLPCYSLHYIFYVPPNDFAHSLGILSHFVLQAFPKTSPRCLASSKHRQCYSMSPILLIMKKVISSFFSCRGILHSGHHLITHARVSDQGVFRSVAFGKEGYISFTPISSVYYSIHFSLKYTTIWGI